VYDETVKTIIEVSQLISEQVPDFSDISELSVSDSIYVVDSERIFWYNGKEVVELTPNELGEELRKEFFRDHVEL